MKVNEYVALPPGWAEAISRPRPYEEPCAASARAHHAQVARLLSKLEEGRGVLPEPSTGGGLSPVRPNAVGHLTVLRSLSGATLEAA